MHPREMHSVYGSTVNNIHIQCHCIFGFVNDISVCVCGGGGGGGGGEEGRSRVYICMHVLSICV